MTSLRALRPGLRSKLLLLSSLLLLLPWFGYQYVKEMEATLQRAQEQMVASLAQALSLELNDKPQLFNTTFEVKAKGGLYVYPLPFTPSLTDASLDDWQQFRQLEQPWQEGSDEPFAGNATSSFRGANTSDGDPLEFRLLLGERNDSLFLYVRVRDKFVVQSKSSLLHLQGVDALELALASREGVAGRYRLSVLPDGSVQAWQQGEDRQNLQGYALEPRIVGQYFETPDGYDYELKLPLGMALSSLVLAVEDVDDRSSGALGAVVSTGDMSDSHAALQRPANELEMLLAAQTLPNFRVRVFDRNEELLFERGDINQAAGLELPLRRFGGNATWLWMRTHLLHPLYDTLLAWFDKINAPEQAPFSGEQSPQLLAAMQGIAQSGYHTDGTSGLRTLEAAWPIAVNGAVTGAVMVDQNLTALHSARNQSLSSLFDAMLAILVLTLTVLLVFVSNLSRRIRSLRDQAEHSIDEQGRLSKALVPSRSSDEIGDLSRSIANMVERIGHYNQYLENLTARLSHELRTPVTVVRSSLENLALLKHSDSEAELYIQRAEEGISRLNLILTNMSEATRLEQILQGSEKEKMALERVFNACVQQYRQIYPSAQFEAEISTQPLWINGSAEHLVQLLDKVVANAVEFSPRGRPIRMICKADNGEAVMTVSNSGPYLDPAMKGRIFDSMVSVRPQGSKGLPHLGLGLHIARLITEFHQGEIYAENLLGESGVIVVIRLPLLDMVKTS